MEAENTHLDSTEGNTEREEEKGGKEKESDTVNTGETDAITDEEFIKRSSCFRGVAFSKHINETLKERSLLELKPDSTIRLQAPTMKEETIEMEIEGYEKRDIFLKCLQTCGIGCDISAKGTGSVFSAEAGYSHKSSENADQQSESHSQVFSYSKLTLCCIPLSCFEPSNKCLSFSQNAFDELLHIEILIREGEIRTAQTACKSFFEKFGTHLFLGNLHFGGIFVVETQYERSNVVDKQNIRNMVESVHTGYTKASYNVLGAFKSEGSASGNLTSASTVDKGKSEECEKQFIKTRCTKIGGPAGVDDIREWKNGLVNNNKTWRLISAGRLDKKEYKGVWDLVSMLREGFNDVKRLASFLQREALLENLDEHKEIEAKIEDLYENFQSTKVVRDHIKIIEKLQYMLQESTFSQDELEIMIQKSSKVTHILKNIPNLGYSDRERAKCAKSMRHVLDIIKGIDFDGKDTVISWTTTNNFIKEKAPDIDSSYDLQSWLRNVEHYCRQNKGLDEVELSTAIAKSVPSTRENFLKKNFREEFILLLALLIPHEYNIGENAFHSLMNAQSVKELVEKGNDAMKKIDRHTDETKRIAMVCAYMLQNCIEREHVWQDHYSLLKNISIPMTILNILNDRTTLSQKKRQLDRLLADNQSQISWKFFESEHDHCRVTDKTEIYEENISLQSVESERDDEMEKICSVFSLQKYFPGKITLQTVQTMSIGIKEKPKEVRDIPWVILIDALSSNSDFRENVLDTFKNKENQDNASLKSRNLRERKKMRVKAGLESKQKNDIKNTAPADLLLAIFLCCNMELRKVLVEKMHQCKFAIPFVYKTNQRINIALWPLREIQVDSDTESVASKHLPIVAFVRIGEVNFPISKSKQINALLRGHNEEYNTFSHKDCPSGSIKRTIANGMIEVSWFVPPQSNDDTVQNDNSTTKEEDAILSSSPVTICNLRGDASLHYVQLQYLSHISSVLVVLVDTDSLPDEQYRDSFKEVYNGQHDTIILTNLKTDEDTDDEEDTEDDSMSKLDKHITLYRVEEKDEQSGNKSVFLTIYNEDDGTLENLSKMKLKLTDELSSLLGRSKKKWSFETMPEYLNCNVIIDEDTPQCALGKKLATEILKSMDCSGFAKQCIVPLQGSNLWQKISESEKKRHSSQLQSVNEGETFLEEYNTLRQRQVHACNEASSAIAEFVRALYKYRSDPVTAYFFLSYLSQGMNLISSEKMRKMRSKTRNEKSGSQMPDPESDPTAESFGLEHLFREVGQIYEAFCSCQDDLKLSVSNETSDIISSLPTVAANLLIYGHTFEIMDGDASNIQQKWVSAVLRELHSTVGECKITTISVLGIQSSGKSTLLNTMFGLKFSVSAGRCTRGIYAQLLSVDLDISKLNCNYMLVLDTEGLRSTEEGSIRYNHDNELSTFVVGLADIILINVKGETIAELENVLQIVAHAFVRFKQKTTDLKLPQTALMIHQNVPAHDAKQKLAEGNKKLVARLDRITREVAIQERVTHISSFSDVINFNHIRDVVYIPDLWLGRPPMSPISPHYSEAVVKLKEKIIDILVPKKSSMTIKFFQKHVDHLWGRIISESLVFSFQNCLEVKAYRLLDAKCQTEVSNLETVVSKWYNDSVRQNFSACNGTFDETKTWLIGEMTSIAQSKGTTCKQDIEHFIKTSDFKDQMLNWQSYKLERFTMSKEKIICDYSVKIEKEKCRIVSDLKGEGLYEEKKKEITLHAKEIAEQLQGRRLSCKEVDKEFATMWSNCLHKIKETEKGKHQSNVTKTLIGEMQSVIDEMYGGENFLHEIRNFHQDPCNISMLQGSWDYQMKEGVHESKKSAFGKVVENVASFFHLGSGNKKPNPKHNVDFLFKRLDSHFSDLSTCDIAPSKPEFRSIVKMTKGMFDETALQGEKLGFVYTKGFESKTSRHIFQFTLEKFTQLNVDYQERHSLISKLLSFKPTARKLFQDVIEEKSDEIIAASMISQDLESIIQDRVDSQIPHELISHVLETCGKKFQLMIKMLEELADKVCKDKKSAFSDLNQYTSSPSDFARHWLRKYAEVHYFGKRKCNEKSEYQTFTSRTLVTTINNIYKCIDIVSETCSHAQVGFEQSNAAPKSDLEQWTNHFRAQLQEKKLTVSEHAFSSAVQGYKITISDDFTANLREKIDELSDKLSQKYEKSGISDITWTDESPFEKLFKTVWGCTEKCPLCGEPCHKTDVDHYSDKADDCHSCIQHKPSGIRGTRDKDSQKLGVESCNFNIKSTKIRSCGRWCKCDIDKCSIFHPYRQYKMYMPEWDIEPSATMTNCKYWMWIITEYRKELAAHYGANEPDIPPSWTNIDLKTAKLNLRQCYGVED